MFISYVCIYFYLIKFVIFSYFSVSFCCYRIFPGEQRYSNFAKLLTTIAVCMHIFSMLHHILAVYFRLVFIHMLTPCCVPSSFHYGIVTALLKKQACHEDNTLLGQFAVIVSKFHFNSLHLPARCCGIVFLQYIMTSSQWSCFGSFQDVTAVTTQFVFQTTTKAFADNG